LYPPGLKEHKAIYNLYYIWKHLLVTAVGDYLKMQLKKYIVRAHLYRNRSKITAVNESLESPFLSNENKKKT
jgi:hypothetical protein